MLFLFYCIFIAEKRASSKCQFEKKVDVKLLLNDMLLFVHNYDASRDPNLFMIENLKLINSRITEYFIGDYSLLDSLKTYDFSELLSKHQMMHNFLNKTKNKFKHDFPENLNRKYFTEIISNLDKFINLLKEIAKNYDLFGNVSNYNEHLQNGKPSNFSEIPNRIDEIATKIRRF